MEEEKKNVERKQELTGQMENGEERKTDKLGKKELEKKREKKNSEKRKKNSASRQFFVVLGFLLGVFLLSAGVYAGWTTYYDSDLIEPFVCSYRESDMHAREVLDAFQNMMDRMKFYRNSGTFFSGNVNYGYYIKLTDTEGGKIYSNMSDDISKIFDKNIRSLMYTMENLNEEQSSGEDKDTFSYYDCYRWDAEGDTGVIYKDYEESRVEVPEDLLVSKKIDKLGICFSEDVLREKQNAWNNYAVFLVIMGAMLLLGVILILYFGGKLFSYRKITNYFRRCFVEIPVALIILAFILLYLCYERKISLFAAANHMIMLETSLGSMQLVMDMIAGALILTGCFFVLFFGVYLFAVFLGEKERSVVSFFWFVYKDYRESLWEGEERKQFLKRLRKPLGSLGTQIAGIWKLFWGVFSGKSIKGSTIAQRERKRALVFAGMLLLCVIGMAAGSRSLLAAHSYHVGDIKNQWLLSVSFALFLMVTAVYLLGTIRNLMDYAVMEEMIQKVYEGKYQEVGAAKKQISEDSVCFSDMEKLEQIGNGFEKAVEDQVHAERMKVELLTNVSHDLKTPLTSIISYVELLDMEPDLPEEAKEYVSILKKKAERLKTIISEVFELAKATSGEIQIEKKEIDFYRLVVQTLADMQDRIDASGLKIKEKLEKENVVIYSDGERMYRVLQNLMDNALKYSMKGTRIYVELVSEDGVVTFTIKNIAGYEMEFEAGDITERFVRGDKNRTTEGSGLGLSIAQGFTIACGGEFAVVIDGDMFKVRVEFPVVEKG